MNKAEWSKKCFVIVENEIAPRAKKLGLSLEAFIPASYVSLLARGEFEGTMTRRELRKILDERMRFLQNDNSKEKEESEET